MTIPLEKKVVTQIPLEELWNSERALQARRGRGLNANDITSLLQTSGVLFAVADCGKPLTWVSGSDTFTFWKMEAKSRIAEPEDPRIQPDNYSGGYCYVASEWADVPVGEIIILLERYH
jgi:hypothetical protein